MIDSPIQNQYPYPSQPRYYSISQKLTTFIEQIATSLKKHQKNLSNAYEKMLTSLFDHNAVRQQLAKCMNDSRQMITNSNKIWELIRMGLGGQILVTKNKGKIYQIPIQLSPFSIEDPVRTEQDKIQRYFETLVQQQQIPMQIQQRLQILIKKLKLNTEVSKIKCDKHICNLILDSGVCNFANFDKKSQISTIQSTIYQENNFANHNLYPTFDDPPSPNLQFSFSNRNSKNRYHHQNQNTTAFNQSINKDQKQISLNLSLSGDRSVFQSFEGRFIKKPNNADFWSPTSKNESEQSALFLYTPQSKGNRKSQQPKNQQVQKIKIFQVPTQILIQIEQTNTKIYEIPTQLGLQKTVTDNQQSQTDQCWISIINMSAPDKTIRKIYEIQTQIKLIGKCDVVGQTCQFIYSGGWEQMEMDSNMKLLYEGLGKERKCQDEEEQLRISDFSKKSVLYSHSQKLSILPCQSINIMNAMYLPNLDRLRSKNQKNDLKKGVHLSASIQSLAFGLTDRKNEKSEEEDKEISPSKVQIDGLSPLVEHPQLNFCASQTLNDNSNNQQNLKASSFFRNSPDFSGGSSLKFKESLIAGSSNPNKIVQFNNSIVQPFKPQHQIYLIDESSSQYSHTLRQMDVSEKQNGRQFQQRQSSIDLADFYQLKEKKMLAQQQNIQLHQRILNLESQLDSIKQQNQEIIQNYKNKLNQINIRISSYESQLGDMQLVVQEKQEINNELSQSNSLKDQEIKALGHRLREKQMKINEFVEEKYINSINFQELYAQLKINYEEKDRSLQLISHQYDLMKTNYEAQANELKLIHQRQYAEIQQLIKANDQLANQIEQLHKEADNKNQIIETLKMQYQQLIDILENRSTQPKYNMQNRSTQLKDKKREQHTCNGPIQMVDGRQEYIKKIENDNRRLHRQVIDNINIIEDQRKMVRELNRAINQLKQDGRKHRLNQETDGLRKEIIALHHQLTKKDELIHQISKSRIDFTQNHGQVKMVLEFIQETQQQQYVQQIKYIQQLETMLMQYQQVIVQNMHNIQDLHHKVFEYLADAMEKEKEGERMYDDILQYEADINGLLLEKLQLQNENKKMKKMICASQKKISAIGNRLVHAAKDKNSNMYQVNRNSNMYQVNRNSNMYQVNRNGHLNYQRSSSALTVRKNRNN